MLPTKRFFPPISALRALEIFERTENVSETARELGLSQSAVSRQLRILEEYLDTALFIRDRKKITLTPSAKSYVVEVRASLNILGTAGLRLKTNPNGGQFNLAILPAFGVRWLAPKLPEFVNKHPEITINLSTRLQPFKFDTEPFHAAIHFGQKDWSNVNYLKLAGENVIAVASPDKVDHEHIRDPAKVFELPLLHLETRRDAWRTWAKIQRVAPPPPQGMVFDQFASIIQAAVHGLGVALMPTYLVERELKDGRLVELGGSDPISIGSYYFVWPATHAAYQPRIQFERWIRGFVAD